MGYTNASCAEHRTQDKSIMAVNETKQSPSSPSCELHARKKINIPQPLCVTRFAKFHQGLVTKVIVLNG